MMNWQPVMFFYAKTTSWVIFPLVLAVLLSKYIGVGSQALFFIFIMLSFGVTCFGIYREIKKYKKDLASPVDELRPRDKNNGK